jgi:hypothetical protein
MHPRGSLIGACEGAIERGESLAVLERASATCGSRRKP